MTDDTRILHAGPVRARLVGTDLRHLLLGDREILRRLAVVVRDEHWGTVVPRVEPVRVDEHDGGFRIQAAARCLQPPLDLRWSLTLIGAADGALTATLEVRLDGDFDYNRIGFVLLHAPDEVAGRPFHGRADGPVTGRLPELVGPQHVAAGLPQPLVPGVHALTLTLDGGLDVAFEFDGDLFETEDQRNWTDGSFKTYSTPLHLGFPHRAHRGQMLRQEVRMAVREAAAPRSAPVPRARDSQPLSVGLGRSLGPVPEIGVALGDATLGPGARRLLAALAPGHLRVDLDPADRWTERLAGAADVSRETGAPVVLALHLPDDGPSFPDALRAALDAHEVTPRRVIVVPRSAGSTPTAAGVAVAAALPGCPVIGGGDDHFAELNQDPFDAGSLDGVAFPVTPQAHLSDDDTLREALVGQRDAVRSARALYPGLQIHVSPLTLRPRHGPGSEARDGLPVGTDARQPTAFAAAWTLGALAALTAGGATSACLYEVAGLRGLMGDDGVPFPVFAVVEDACRRTGQEAWAAVVGDPLAAAGLWVRDEGEPLLLLANLSDDRQWVAPDGTSTDRWRAEPVAGDEPTRDGRHVVLPPHAVALLRRER